MGQNDGNDNRGPELAPAYVCYTVECPADAFEARAFNAIAQFGTQSIAAGGVLRIDAPSPAPVAAAGAPPTPPAPTTAPTAPVAPLSRLQKLRNDQAARMPQPQSVGKEVR